MDFTRLSKDQIISAIHEFEERSNEFPDSNYYDILFEGKRYPPKPIVAIAYENVTGKKLDTTDFRGGLKTPAFKILENNGFQIVEKQNFKDENYQLVNYLRKFPDYNWVDPFFDFLQLMIQSFDFKEGDQRLAFTLRKDKTQISINIGNRMVACLFLRNKQIYQSFMINQEDLDDVRNLHHYYQHEPEFRFKSDPPGSLISFHSDLNPFETKKIRKHWIKSINSYLTNVKSAGQPDNHKSDIFKMAVDRAFRKKIISETENMKTEKIDIPRIFVAPRSGEKSTENFEKTIEGGYKKSDLIQFLSKEDREALKDQDILMVWGNKPSLKARWDKMRADDYVIFYQKGIIRYVGKLLYKCHNKLLADNLWGQQRSENGELISWEYVYFLKDMRETQIPYKTMADLAGYKGAVVQGFTPYKEAGVKRIIDKYGSVESFFFGDQEVSNSKTDLSCTEILDHVSEYIKSKGFKYSIPEITNFYLSLKTKPFVILAGISGTGKTQLAKKFAEAINCEQQMIPVRPDWTDNSDLIGYLDLQGNFRRKPLLETIVQANANPNKIFFVVLDEMNLARVEHYFSDFLSIIETRDTNGKSEHPIISNSEIGEGDENLDLQNLKIPDNLYIIGTVNMDETTHPFSRKVLDRANSIEMNEIDLNWIEDLGKEMQPVSDVYNDFLKSNYIFSKDITDKDKADLSITLDLLKAMNEILEKGDLQFGYRVRDEICFYMLNRREVSELISEEQALDFQVMQKILPRIQGSSLRLKSIILELLKKLNPDIAGIQNLNIKDSQITSDDIEKLLSEAESRSFERSSDKLLFMFRRFEEDGFTSFWL